MSNFFLKMSSGFYLNVFITCISIQLCLKLNRSIQYTVFSLQMSFFTPHFCPRFLLSLHISLLDLIQFRADGIYTSTCTTSTSRVFEWVRRLLFNHPKHLIRATVHKHQPGWNTLKQSTKPLECRCATSWPWPHDEQGKKEILTRTNTLSHFYFL